MKNGKVNNFKNLYKIKGENIKNIDRVIWVSKEDKKLSIKDILYGIQAFDDQINKELEISIDQYLDYKIIGYIVTDYEYIYLITDSSYKCLYISIGKSHPLFWYKFNTRKSFTDNFDNICNTYTKNTYNYNMSGYTKVFMGDDDLLSINIHDIENQFILQKFTDNMIYGSLWNDHPFRNEYKNTYINPIKSAILTGQAMRQSQGSPYSVSVRTLYSKSLITVYDYKGIYIMEISYDPINTQQTQNLNSLLEANYNLDMPIDVLITILGFPFITYRDILQMKPLTRYHMIILGFLSSRENIGQEIVKEFKVLLDKKDVDNFDEIVYNDMNDFIEMADNHNI